MKLTFPNVPLEVLDEIAWELEQYGCNVAFEEGRRRGHMSCPAGAVQFDHANGNLTVVILLDKGHFPKGMLVGGMRQLVEEAVERFQQKAAIA
jgi:hypothetical protein